MAETADTNEEQKPDSLTSGKAGMGESGKSNGMPVTIEERKRWEIEDLAGKPYDSIPRVNLNNAEVIRRHYLSHMREPMLTIRPDGIQFNNSAIMKLPETLYILPMIDHNEKYIYIIASEEDEEDSQKWANLKDDKRQSRKITGRDLGKKIYRLMGWNKGYYYRAYGSLALKEGEDDVPVLCFNLKEADKDFLTEKARIALDIELEDLGEEVSVILAEDERRRTEREQREKDKAEGKTPKKRKKTTMHSDEFGEDDFGPKYSEYKGRVRIPRPTDGQMTLDEFTTLTNDDRALTGGNVPLTGVT